MRLLQQYALAILMWHAEYGGELARTRLGGRELERYRSELERLHALSAEAEGSPRLIAEAQMERLQWSSEERFPEELRRDFGLEARTLGEVARLILGFDDHGDNDTSPLGRNERRTLRYRSEEDLLNAARAIYPQYAANEASSGVGGVELLVAFALERQERDGHVTFLPPEAYGLTEVPTGARENDLLDLVRNGVLTIDAIGDTVSRDEEENDAVPDSRERE